MSSRCPRSGTGRLAENLHLSATPYTGCTLAKTRTKSSSFSSGSPFRSFSYYTWQEISGGFKMRFELARALVSRPKLLVLDDLLAPLDIRGSAAVSSGPARPGQLDSVNRCRSLVSSTTSVLRSKSIADQLLFLDGGKQVDRWPAHRYLAKPLGR